MTPEQQAKLNRFLAERVMGKQGEALIPDYVKDWNSCQYLLDKIEQDELRWAWTKDKAEPYRCIVMGATGSPVFCAYAENRTEALCLAIAKAYGWED